MADDRMLVHYHHEILPLLKEAYASSSGSVLVPHAAAIPRVARQCLQAARAARIGGPGADSRLAIALRGLGRSDCPPWLQDTLVALHLTERVLGLGPDGLPDALRPEVAVHRARRRPYGTYPTPNLIVERMCKNLVGAAGHGDRPLTVLDLSLEGGHFAICMLALHEQRQVHFFGMDRDPAAIALAQVLLRSAVRSSRATGFSWRTSCQDSIGKAPPRSWPRSYDAVIGNPPWKALHATDDRILRTRYESVLTGRFDVYLAFIQRADELLDEGGHLSMVVPSAFLFNRSGSRSRCLLLDRYDIHSLEVYPRRIFRDTPQIVPVAFLARKRAGRRRRTAVHVRYISSDIGHADRSVTARRVEQSIFARLPAQVLHPFADLAEACLESINTSSMLQDHGVLVQGARLVSRNPRPAGAAFTGLRAKNIAPFHAKSEDAELFEEDDHRFDRTPPTAWLSRSKVVFQDLRCITSRRLLVAARAGRGELPLSTAAMFVPHSDGVADFFEVLLNSALANAWYKAHDITRAIKLSVLSELPIPTVADGTALRAQRLMAASVAREARRLAARGSDDWEPLVDEFVFGLFELREHEIWVVRQLSEARVF